MFNFHGILVVGITQYAGPNPAHESVFRSYQILQAAQELLEEGAPAKVVAAFISEAKAAAESREELQKKCDGFMDRALAAEERIARILRHGFNETDTAEQRQLADIRLTERAAAGIRDYSRSLAALPKKYRRRVVLEHPVATPAKKTPARKPR